MAQDSNTHRPRKDQPLSIETLVVQSALDDPLGKAKPFVPPIVPSIGFTHPTMDDMDRAFAYQGGAIPADANSYVYARYGAPNASAFEEAVGLLEGARGAAANQFLSRNSLGTSKNRVSSLDMDLDLDVNLDGLVRGNLSRHSFY
jgi:hypothetical protein